MSDNNKNNDKPPDSSRVAHVGRSGKRRHTSIRVDSGLWEAFEGACRADGQRTCEVLELIILGYTVGVTTQHKIGAQPTTINVTANLLKEIKRERRYAKEEQRGAEEGPAFVPCAFSGCGCRNPAVVEMRNEGVGRVFSCPGHIEYFGKRGFAEYGRVLES